jgi:ABC-type transport system involved in multi-copper enzyme maturation permease subunit
MNARGGPRLGLGPVFAYDWIVASRRWQGYAVRTLFAAILLAALIAVAAKSVVPDVVRSSRDLAKLGEAFYVAIVGTQLTLVLLAAPASTAGSICSDRASGTMTHVLVTDLSDVEIVLGKLAARLVPVLGLVACALPIMAILTLLGGVDPEALFGAFLVTIGVAVLGCSLALLCSLWARRTHEALLGTYAIWAIWLVGRPFISLVNGAFGWSLALPVRTADPYYLIIAPYWYPGQVSYTDYLAFAGVAAGISTVLTGVAVARLRPVCTRVTVARKQSHRGRLDRASTWLAPASYLPRPSLDFNPVLWRECHRGRPSRWAGLAVGLFVVGAVTASVAAILLPRSTYAMAWVNGLQVAIGMLLLSVTAATSLAEERVRGSLDVLMTTTLSTREIVIGKWLGSFRMVPLLAILPAAVVLCNDPRRLLYVPTLFMTLVFVFACGAAICGLGLAMAIWCPRLGRSVALTISVYVLITVGWLFLGIWFASGRDEGLMMASPFFFAGELAADLCGGGNRGHLGWAVFWASCYAVAALVFLQGALATFNRCLERIEFGISRRDRPTPIKREPAPATQSVGEAFDPA